ncbi:Alpha/Beta hydrolase protein [Xylariomycetidae sp. FL2044]|nr:Alpha/Beta hydrolase protein [Xylariomycetidae sp. FL2044]
MSSLYSTKLAAALGLLASTVSNYDPQDDDGLNFAFPAANADNATSGVEPFQVSVDPGFIDYTLEKVRLYRPSRDLVGYDNDDWNEGPQRRNMTELAAYWAGEYDWFAVQDQINANFTHYTVTVDGSGSASTYSQPIPLHFVHERSHADDAIPLLLLHGWPSSFLEWRNVIKPLASPADASSDPSFHVVAPDLPGFGFSPAPTHVGMGPREMGAAFDALMRTHLGYERYAVLGTDLGYFVSSWMCTDDVAAGSLRVHLTDSALVYPNAADQARLAANQTSAEESAYMAGLATYLGENAGYVNVQSTRPLSLAVGMTDSPVGFAGWIWQLARVVGYGPSFGLAELITDTLMVWIQGTYGNIRAYKEFWKPENQAVPKTTVPTAVMEWANPDGPFPSLARFTLAPRDWIERNTNLTYFSRHEFGGHFPALYYPDAWIEDVRSVFRDGQY